MQPFTCCSKSAPHVMHLKYCLVKPTNIVYSSHVGHMPLTISVWNLIVFSVIYPFTLYHFSFEMSKLLCNWVSFFVTFFHKKVTWLILKWLKNSSEFIAIPWSKFALNATHILNCDLTLYKSLKFCLSTQGFVCSSSLA